MFEKYKYVLAVYENKSFTKASQTLFISQPSLSVAIKNIENEIGSPLFERSGGGVVPTEIGWEYVRIAERIRLAETEFERRIEDIYNLESGHLTVGGTNYLSSYLLPRIINHFSSQHPKIEVSLVEAHSTDLLTMLEKEEIDVIVDSFDDSIDYLHSYPLASERILLCVPASNPINERLREFSVSVEEIHSEDFSKRMLPYVPITEFKDERFILLKTGNDMYKRAMTIFREADLTPAVLFRVDQLNIAYALAESGMGLCFVTDTFFKHGIAHSDVCLYNVSGEECKRTLHVAYKKGKYCTRAMAEFINSAKEVIINA